MEIKAFKIIGISRDEAESMGVSRHHHRQFGDLSVFYHLFSWLAPSALSVPCPLLPHVSTGLTGSTINPFLIKLPKSRITAHVICSIFFSACQTNFHNLFNLIPPSRSSRQLFTTISDHPKSKTIFSILINPTPIIPTYSSILSGTNYMTLVFIHSDQLDKW